MRKATTIVLATLGSLGDLYPYLAIACELDARGHHPIIATSASFRHIVEKQGIEFREVGPDFPRFVTRPDWIRMATDRKRGAEYIIRRMIPPFLEGTYADTVEAVQDADLVVTHSMGYAAKLAAEKHGIPWAVGGLQPSIFFSTYDPPAVLPSASEALLGFLGRPYCSAMFALVKAITRRWAAPIREFRRKLGLPDRRIDPFIDGQFSQSLNLALFSSLLAREDPDWPPHTVQTGFVFFRDGDSSGGDPRSYSGATDGTGRGASVNHGLGRDLVEFLEAGRPPIVFTLGSLAVLNAGSFYAESVSAARRLGRRIVLLAGDNPPDAASVQPGEDLFVAGFVPHAAIFPRASVVVHQGGIGTTAEALRAGRPMLIVPFSNDQPDNARRAERLGVAREIARSDYRSRRVASEIRVLLERPEYSQEALAVSTQIAEERGAQCACDAIEGLIGIGTSRPLSDDRSSSDWSLPTP